MREWRVWCEISCPVEACLAAVREEAEAGEDVVDHVAGVPRVVEDPLIKQGVEAHPVVGDNQEAFQIEAHVVVDQEAFQIEEEVDQGE